MEYLLRIETTNPQLKERVVRAFEAVGLDVDSAGVPHPLSAVLESAGQVVWGTEYLPEPDDSTLYTQCVGCDHFVTDNPAFDGDPTVARYDHLDDGDREHSHEARPGDRSAPLAWWKAMRPDLFVKDPVTGKIGPNRDGVGQ